MCLKVTLGYLFGGDSVGQFSPSINTIGIPTTIRFSKKSANCISDLTNSRLKPPSPFLVTRTSFSLNWRRGSVLLTSFIGTVDACPKFCFQWLLLGFRGCAAKICSASTMTFWLWFRPSLVAQRFHRVS